ncbi:MAG TPA: aromatic ring-hydroxylating dioxygenase subunit alpha [Burkholderiales bacterium]
MSDIGRASQLRPAVSQLPVNAYHDQNIFEAEMRTLFAPRHAPGYVGHELMVPNAGDYHTIGWMNDALSLVRNANGVELISNVCRHRQAIMLNGRGNAKNIVCPLHRWTYNMQGELLGAPYFGEKPCLDLHKRSLKNWNGLLFTGERDIAAELAGLGVANQLNFEGYMLDRVVVNELDYNWKTFIEVYLEDYHVEPFHPGLGGFVTCEDLAWEYGARHSVQTVGVNSALARPGSDKYKQWHDQVLQYRGGEAPPHGAIWLTLYPNIMVEWYPHVLVVSNLIPRGPQKTTNVVEFYYPEEIVLFEREFVEAEQAAYMETAVEDDEIALRMDAGRRALLEQGLNQVGPYQSPMEDGMQHFHEYLRREMGEAFASDAPAAPLPSAG